jgi:hypothetical protein
MRRPRMFITSVWSIVCICLTIKYAYSKVRRNPKKKKEKQTCIKIVRQTRGTK